MMNLQALRCGHCPGVSSLRSTPRSMLSQKRYSQGVRAYHRPDDIHDWRVKQMVEAVNVYFTDILSRAPSDLVVGQKMFKDLVKSTRKAYPDYYVEITEVGVCDMHRLFVMWQGVATNLGEYHGHKPSHHASNISGINLMCFNEDRSLITEANVFRTPMTEDKVQLEEKEAEDHNMHELHLHRLT